LTTGVVVLLTEDEILISLDLAEALRETGFAVLATATSTEALQGLEADPLDTQAVITDMRFGRGPDGWEVARRARERDPVMPVVRAGSGNPNSGVEWVIRATSA
jgi:DNA-binding response OmpR family regulator